MKRLLTAVIWVPAPWYAAEKQAPLAQKLGEQKMTHLHRHAVGGARACLPRRCFRLRGTDAGRERHRNRRDSGAGQGQRREAPNEKPAATVNVRSRTAGDKKSGEGGATRS